MSRLVSDVLASAAPLLESSDHRVRLAAAEVGRYNKFGQLVFRLTRWIERRPVGFNFNLLKHVK